jgi:hypothetical protein
MRSGYGSGCGVVGSTSLLIRSQSNRQCIGIIMLVAFVGVLCMVDGACYVITYVA